MNKRKINGITLYESEAIETLTQLAKQGIKADLILTDLPYGTTPQGWDKVLLSKEMWKALDGITNPNTPILLFGAEPFSSHLRLSNLQNYKYDWIWEKTSATNAQSAKRQPLRAFENIMVFYKKQCPYYPQKTKGHPRKVSTAKVGKDSEVYNKNTSDVAYDSMERYPRNALQIYFSFVNLTKKDNAVSALSKILF